MAHYDHEQASAVYPPLVTAYPPPGQVHPPPHPMQGYPQGPYVAPPPPMGYPTKDGPGYPQHGPGETQSRGDGFWKGCFAALCCCCVLDMCFC